VDALDDLERARFERHLAECAACRAIDDKATTWKLDYANLRTRLLANGQILEWQ